MEERLESRIVSGFRKLGQIAIIPLAALFIYESFVGDPAYEKIREAGEISEKALSECEANPKICTKDYLKKLDEKTKRLLQEAEQHYSKTLISQYLFHKVLTLSPQT